MDSLALHYSCAGTILHNAGADNIFWSVNFFSHIYFLEGKPFFSENFLVSELFCLMNNLVGKLF
jgi:hypothetical protein